MDDLKDDFLQRSAAALRALTAELDQTGDITSGAFRTLHTIKGTAQTFGFASVARAAHELEDILSSGNVGEFAAGLRRLTVSFENPSTDDGYKTTLPVNSASRTLITRIPLDVIAQFSDVERKNLASAISVYRFDVAFRFDEFAARYKMLAEKLDIATDVISRLPGLSGDVSFQIFLATEKIATLEAIATEFSATVEDQALPENTLTKSLRQIADHTAKLGNETGKTIDIIISSRVNESRSETVQRIFDILLHLVRNAIDHAFIEKGRIDISLKPNDGDISLTVSDNGGGIDREKLATKAAGIGLQFEEDLIDLIFHPGLSTTNTVSETSGRGVGLDAVKNIVEGAGGTIKVESDDSGTIFRIAMPA